MVRSKNLIPKINLFWWKVAHGKILTIDNLKKKDFYLVNRCYLCNEVEETIMHLMFQCPYSKEIWYFFLMNLIIEWVFPPLVKMFIDCYNLCPYSHNIIMDLWRQVPLFLTWGCKKKGTIELSGMQLRIVKSCVCKYERRYKKTLTIASMLLQRICLATKSCELSNYGVYHKAQLILIG